MAALSRRRTHVGYASYALRRHALPLCILFAICIFSGITLFESINRHPDVKEQESYMKRFAVQSNQVPIKSTHTRDKTNIRRPSSFNATSQGGSLNTLLELNQESSNSLTAISKSFVIRSKPPSGHMAIILVIYVGRMLPSYFHAFALSVERSGPHLKWLIFVTEAHEFGDYYSNIEVVRIPKEELEERITRVDPRMNSSHVRYLMENAPYALVEFKPCLATIFEVRRFV
jgi:hypothetical protein